MGRPYSEKKGCEDGDGYVMVVVGINVDMVKNWQLEGYKIKKIAEYVHRPMKRKFRE